jgi:hypothetical protein
MRAFEPRFAHRPSGPTILPQLAVHRRTFDAPHGPTPNHVHGGRHAGHPRRGGDHGPAGPTRGCSRLPCRMRCVEKPHRGPVDGTGAGRAGQPSALRPARCMAWLCHLSDHHPGRPHIASETREGGGHERRLGARASCRAVHSGRRGRRTSLMSVSRASGHACEAQGSRFILVMRRQGRP